MYQPSHSCCQMRPGIVGLNRCAAARCQHFGTSHLANLRLTAQGHADRFARMILHHQYQVALNGVQPWSNITTEGRKNLFLDNPLLQFFYLLEHSFWQFHSHIARVLCWAKRPKVERSMMLYNFSSFVILILIIVFYILFFCIFRVFA